MPIESVDVGFRLREIIAELLGRGPGQTRFKAGQRLREDLGFDSVLIVDLMVEVELRLGVLFDPVEHDLAAIFETVGSLEDWVKGAVEGR